MKMRSICLVVLSIWARNAYATALGDPGISNILVDGQVPNVFNSAGPFITVNHEDSAVITWTTANPATDQVVLFGNSVAACGDPGPYKLYPFNITGVLSTGHSIRVTRLNPNTVYCFRVVSSDGSGQGWTVPLVTSEALAFQTTPVDPNAAKNYRIDLEGSKNIYAGSAIYIVPTPVLMGGKDDDWAELGIPVLKN